MDNATSLASQSLTDAVRALLDSAPRQWLPYALGLLLGYPLLTGSLRYQRVRNMYKKYPYATREDMANMTDDHAFEIQKAVAQLEFPFMFVKSLQFALFRVCTSYTHGLYVPSHYQSSKQPQQNLPIYCAHLTNHPRPTASQQSPTSSPKPANSPAQRHLSNATQTQAPSSKKWSATAQPPHEPTPPSPAPASYTPATEPQAKFSTTTCSTHSRSSP